MSVYVHDTHLACDWRLPRVVVCTCNAILPQAHEHVNSIEDVQAAPTQVLYSPSLYTQPQPRGFMREVHIIMLPGNWDANGGMPIILVGGIVCLRMCVHVHNVIGSRS